MIENNCLSAMVRERECDEREQVTGAVGVVRGTLFNIPAPRVGTSMLGSEPRTQLLAEESRDCLAPHMSTASVWTWTEGNKETSLHSGVERFSPPLKGAWEDSVRGMAGENVQHSS